MRLLIVGNRGGTNIGGSLESAARDLGWEVQLMPAREADAGPRWLRRVRWHLMGHAPLRLGSFSAEVARFCREFRPDLLLSTGQAPIRAEALREIGRLGICRANYLTDDPWNPSHRAGWYLRGLRHYDHLFTTRRSIFADLRKRSGAAVTFVPFAYDPALFYAERLDGSDQQEPASDLCFAGGADGDRVPYLWAAARSGMRVALYGSYWERYAETRSLTRGQADVATVRRALCATRVALCLVRRANRDGHCMRTFEVPAVGACMLAERTEEHRELLGPEEQAVLYFGEPAEMVSKLQWLIQHPGERSRLAEAAHRLITGGRHTYRDRLWQMAAAAGMTGQAVNNQYSAAGQQSARE